MLVYIPRCLFNYQSVIQTYRDYEELYSEEDKPRYYIYITDNTENTNTEMDIDYMLNYMSSTLSSPMKSSIVYDRPITENYYDFKECSLDELETYLSNAYWNIAKVFDVIDIEELLREL